MIKQKTRLRLHHIKTVYLQSITHYYLVISQRQTGGSIFESTNFCKLPKRTDFLLQLWPTLYTVALTHSSCATKGPNKHLRWPRFQSDLKTVEQPANRFRRTTVVCEYRTSHYRQMTALWSLGLHWVSAHNRVFTGHYHTLLPGGAQLVLSLIAPTVFDCVLELYKLKLIN